MKFEEEDGYETASDVSEETVLDTEPIVEDLELNDDEEVDLAAELEAERKARAKAEEIAENQRIRAEKAEKKVKGVETKPEPVETKTNAPELSAKDLYAMMEAKIPQADIDDVLEYAKFKNIPVSEALSTSAVKAILAEKQESRSVADASNTGTVRRGSSKISDETLLAKASKGELPDNDDDLRRLIRLRKGVKS